MKPHLQRPAPPGYLQPAKILTLGTAVKRLSLKCHLQLATKAEDRSLISQFDIPRCQIRTTDMFLKSLGGLAQPCMYVLGLNLVLASQKVVLFNERQAISPILGLFRPLCSCANIFCFLCKGQQWHRAQWWRLRIQSENLHKDERSYQREVSLLNYTFQWIRTKLKNVVDIRSLGWLLKRSIFQHVNSSLSTWLYLTLSPVSILSAEIGNLCHTVSASPEGQ